MQRELGAFRELMQEWLGDGARCRDRKAAALCSNLLAVEPALWTFLYRRGVEPTNNHIERLLRPGCCGVRMPSVVIVRRGAASWSAC